ncbi:MAG: PAS domain-containing protein [Phycisphaerae bacterium]|nr:PAS domain-containing protein [Phycisphaerae bacterium]
MARLDPNDITVELPTLRPDWHRKGRWLRVHGFLPLTLPPLLVAVALASGAEVLAYRNESIGLHSILWSLTIMAIALATASLVLGWYSSRWRMAALQQQLEQLTTTGRTELIDIAEAGELAGLVAALNVYVSQIRNRGARMRLQKKELDIQTRIAEAEKRCVETVVEKISEPVIITDAFDEVVLANRGAQEVFGFSLGAAVRQPLHQAIRNPAMVQLIKAMRAPDEPAQRSVTIRLNSDTAQPQTFRASLTRVVDPRGHVHGVVTVLRPVEQRQPSKDS